MKFALLTLLDPPLTEDDRFARFRDRAEIDAAIRLRPASENQRDRVARVAENEL